MEERGRYERERKGGRRGREESLRADQFGDEEREAHLWRTRRRRGRLLEE
jgi:hypothetical protein